MNGGTPTPGWYPDPHDPSQMRYWDGTTWTGAAARPATSVAGVFGRAFAYGLIIGVVTGIASGTAGAPVLGTIIGPFVGLAIGVPVSLIAAAVIAISARPPVTAKAYRRRVDVTLVILGVATATLAAGWISRRPLFGPWSALTMLAVVVACLVFVRPRLHRLVPTPTA